MEEEWIVKYRTALELGRSGQPRRIPLGAGFAKWLAEIRASMTGLTPALWKRSVAHTSEHPITAPSRRVSD